MGEVRKASISRNRISVLFLVSLVLVATLCLPVNLANAKTQIIKVDKLTDYPNYKETMFTLMDENGTYNVFVRANMTRIGSETCITIIGTLIDSTNTTVNLSVAIPDTLLDHPVVGKVEAIHVHISEEGVENLVYLILPIVFLVSLIAEILVFVPLEIVNLILRIVPFFWASIPYVLETLLVSDHNSDDTGQHTIIPDFLHLGSFDLFLPIQPYAALPSGGHYYVSTNKNWWIIEQHEVRAPWPIDWLVLYTYYSTRKVKPAETIIPGPVASFSWRPVQPVVGEQVVFTSTSYSQDPRSFIPETGYHWWLGEGLEKTDKNFTFVYNSPGNYDVTLKVTDNNTLTSNVTNTITVLSAPLARLRVVPDHLVLSVQSGQHVTASFAVFESLNETDLHNVAFLAYDLPGLAGGAIPSSDISFDKNGFTVLRGSYVNVTVDVYASTALQYGWYSGNITITSDDGGNATVFTDVFVLSPPYGPKAEFTVDPETANVGQLITFNASSSQPGWNGTNQMPITKYSWDFGDGNKSDTINPTTIHAFSSPGIFYPTFTVYASGATPETDTITKKVFIVSTPVGGYSISMKGYNLSMLSSVYLALLMILSTVFTTVRLKTRRKK